MLLLPLKNFFFFLKKGDKYPFINWNINLPLKNFWAMNIFSSTNFFSFTVFTEPSCVLDPLIQAAEELQILEVSLNNFVTL